MVSQTFYRKHFRITQAKFNLFPLSFCFCIFLKKIPSLSCLPLFRFYSDAPLLMPKMTSVYLCPFCDCTFFPHDLCALLLFFCISLDFAKKICDFLVLTVNFSRISHFDVELSSVFGCKFFSDFPDFSGWWSQDPPPPENSTRQKKSLARLPMCFFLFSSRMASPTAFWREM